MQQAEIPCARSAFGRTAQILRNGGTMPAGTLSNTRGRGHALKEVCGVEDRIGRKAGMKMFENFAVAAPTVEGKVAGADDHVAFVGCQKHGELRMEYTLSNGHGLDLVVLTDPLRALFAEAC